MPLNLVDLERMLELKMRRWPLGCGNQSPGCYTGHHETLNNSQHKERMRIVGAIPSCKETNASLKFPPSMS